MVKDLFSFNYQKSNSDLSESREVKKNCKARDGEEKVFGETYTVDLKMFKSPLSVHTLITHCFPLTVKFTIKLAWKRRLIQKYWNFQFTFQTLKIY